MKHKSLLVYVPCLDGGCEDVGRIELAGHTLVSDERLWDLEAAEKHANELEERCVKWEAVFGHLGDTPDECGNAIIAARDELEERCAVLTDALHQISLCSQNSMSSREECGRIARAALEKSK